jgi:hypothetical protein
MPKFQTGQINKEQVAAPRGVVRSMPSLGGLLGKFAEKLTYIPIITDKNIL